MAKIIFLDPHSNASGSMLGNGRLRGTQNTTILLAESLAARGHVVECITRKEEERLNGVHWLSSPSQNCYDLAISNRYPHPLDLVNAEKKCLWVRNPLNRWSRFRKSIGGILCHRPAAVVLSDFQLRTTPFIFPFKGRYVIEHGTDDALLRRPQPRHAPKPIAAYASYAYRNLQIVIDIWKKRIHPNMDNAELHIFCKKSELEQYSNLEEYNIIVRGRVPRDELIAFHKQARLLLYPGHSEETFCNVAHEATACGLPIITMGIGSLVDRVTSGENGYVVQNADEMAQKTLELLSDDQKWEKLHQSTLAYTKGFYDWANRAEVWEKTFLID